VYEELNRAGVALRAPVRRRSTVLADVGPSGLVMEPLGDGDLRRGVRHLASSRCAALAAERPDAIMLETFTDIAEARCALLAARSVTDLPVFVST